MRPFNILCVLVALLVLNNYSQAQKNSPSHRKQGADHHPNTTPVPSTSTTSRINEPTTDDQQKQSTPQATNKWSKAFAPETWSTWAAFVVGVFVLVVYICMLKSMTNTAERQLRAYVVAELGSIVNIADPVKPTPAGYVPTEAVRKFPWGPVGRVQIKNTGQTPAFKVEHWGNMCFREYPLTSPLPPNAPGDRSVSIIGPGIINTKTLSIVPILTDDEVAALRNVTAAIYFYGEISYEDAFKKRHMTKYRLFHNQISGPVGIGTDFTFYKEGNEAD